MKEQSLKAEMIKKSAIKNIRRKNLEVIFNIINHKYLYHFRHRYKNNY